MKRPLPSLSTCGCALLLASAFSACQSDDTATISGHVVESRTAALTSGAATGASATTARAITHVMAIDPESANPIRVLAPVARDGGFHLDVNFGHPYVLVFIDSSRIGTDMVVSIFKARTLDTLAPRTKGEVNLGEVTSMGGQAVASVPYDTLLQQLGLSGDAAALLGEIDDLSLRYANPDIDGDGVIDMQQPGHRFQLDFHLRAEMLAGPGGVALRMVDITDRFAPESGPRMASPHFNSGSIYALYPSSFDATNYVAYGTPGVSLQNGAAFRATASDGSAIDQAHSSFSALSFNGDTQGWGPDYNWTQPSSVELPGSGGTPVDLAFTLGGAHRTLTFANVVTRTRESLEALNTPVPFLRVNTAQGLISSIDYKWMQRTSAGAWSPVSAEQLDLVVGDAGAFVGFSRGSKANRVEMTIPRQPSGTLPWTAAATAANDICSMALSYDDKLGLRLFVGGVLPNDGVAPCF
jgi:hypothetical protein